MRSTLPFLLFAFLMITACRPVLPPEALASFVPDQLPIAQNVAGAFAAQTAENPFITLYPELRNAPAPRWLRAGTRVSYRLNFANFARDRDQPTPSGSGLIQYDIVAQNRQNVVMLSTMINTQIQGQITPLSYKVERPGIGEIWFSPRVLETAEAAASADFEVARLPLEVEGETYDVIHMTSHTVTDEGQGETVWAFEVETGLLVFYREALFWPDGSQRSGTTVSFLAQRQIRLPWRNGTLPEWLERGYEFHFNGSQAVDVGVGSAVPVAMSATTRIAKVGANWSEHTQTVVMYGQQMEGSSGATGVQQLFGGFWLPPEALDVLETGDVLDQDRLTGIETQVVEANNQQIVIQASGAGYLSQLAYDARDGRLTSIYLEQHTQAATIYTYLEAR